MSANQKCPENQSEVVVVMVPFVAQGHLNQLLHLSRLISAYNIPVHFLSTATHLRQARRRHHSAAGDLIHFHELPTPYFTSPPPNPNSTTNFPTHLQPSFNSTLHLRRPAADLILSLSKTARKTAVIHDSLMSYVVQDVHSIPNAETYVFRALSVFFILCFMCDKLGIKPPFEPHILRRIPPSGDNFSQEFIEFVKLQHSHPTIHVGNLYDSTRIVEGEFIEFLEKKEIYGKNHWAVGPFNPTETKSDYSDSNNRHKCLQWLDKQPANSVIYVSFGTTTTFTEEQIIELAVGLEKSRKRFLWVLREADKGDVFENEDIRRPELPRGYPERVAERGLVVREWAPQVDILGHVSVGGFISHCGWNSCMEAMTMGVGVATWPMHSDQPRNAFLLTDILRVGLVMRDWVRKDELLTAEMVEMGVRRLMDTPEGEGVRRRAVELGGAVRRSVAEDGVTRKELDSFVSYICSSNRVSIKKVKHLAASI